MDLKEIGYDDVGWIHMAQDTDKWWALVDRKTNMGVFESWQQCSWGS